MDATQANAVLNAILRQSSTASTTGIKCRLGTNAPTASVDMTELSGTGYTTGGTVMTFAVASGQASSNTSTASWTNGSGSTWTINGIELWDQAGSPVRWLFGSWTGAPISVANGNSFSVAAAGVSVTAALYVLFCYHESMPRGKKPSLTPEQDAEIAALYRAGQTMRAIGAVYGTTWHPIALSLKRSGVESRTMSDYRWQDTPENRAELVRLWRGGLGVRKIAHQVGTSNDRVSRILREEGIQARYGGGNRVFKDADLPGLAAQYNAGASIAKLTQSHGCSKPSVRKALTRAGVTITNHGHDPKFWTTERIEWLKEQALSRSVASIAAEVDYSQTAISEKLKDLGLLERRTRRWGPDNHSWKGGYTNRDGYVLARVTDEDRPFAGRVHSGGYIPEHRLVMARALGRPLTDKESVHHINGDKQDNRLENLQLRANNHGKGIMLQCLDCGSHNVEAVPLT